MNILSNWLREYLPSLDVTDRQLADDLTLRGVAVEGVHDLGKGKGHLFEMDITTNRVDAMNHYGVAREAAAIYDIPLRKLDAELPVARAAAAFPVRIEKKDLCGRFTAQVVRGVSIAASTGDVAEKFALLGQKPISNAVDVTNYTWLAMGHPTHAFDLDKIEGGIVVRRARAGEKLQLLDGSEKVLFDDDLVVADEVKALALAGVMGGWESRVTEETKNILVEAAWFDQAAIRRSSRRHGLHTDASHRFERGADFAAAPLANRLVTKRILEACGGSLEGEMVDLVIPEIEAKTAKRKPISLSVSEVQRLLGTTLEDGVVPANVVEQYLEALGCHLRPAREVGVYEVTLPSWRLDLEREIDLIEEVARVYGYNRFANSLPTFAGAVVELPHASQEEVIRGTLLSLGWTEAISSTFCSNDDANRFIAQSNNGATSGNGVVPMENPLNAEAGVLRPSLAPGMATMLAGNLNRDSDVVRLFELGTIFTGSTATVSERPSLSLGATGGGVASSLITAADAVFFEMKGAVETLLSRFSLGNVTFSSEGLPQWMEPGRGARVLAEDKVLGWFGELSAAESERRKLKQVVVQGEISASALYAASLKSPLAVDPSRYQAVERDFSFVFSDEVLWGQVEGAIRGLNIAELQTVAPVEIFRDAKGKAVPAGEHSLLLRVRFQSNDRTLREEELTEWQQRIVSALSALGGKQRA